MSNKPQEIISLGKRCLSIPLYGLFTIDKSFVYPGDKKPSSKEVSNIKKTGYGHNVYNNVSEHIGTHIDAPNHQISELKEHGVEVFLNDAKFYCNKCCFLDLSNSEDASEFKGQKYLLTVTRAHLEPIKPFLENEGGLAVLIRTGFDKVIEKHETAIEDPNLLPYIATDAVEDLEAIPGINVIAIDSPTIDPPGEHTAHKLLTKSKMVVEGVRFAYNIPEDTREFELRTAIIGFHKATGGPVAIRAIIPLD